MTRDLSINFGAAVTTPFYQLMAADGSLGSQITAGFVHVISGVYFLSQVNVGSARGVYWGCVEGLDAFDLLYQNQDGAGDSLLKIQAAVYDSASVSGSAITLSNGKVQTVTAAGRTTA